jgi:MoxR-like ATPase
MSITVIKTSKRTLREACNRCHITSEYYWGQVRETGVRVLLDQSVLNEGIAFTDQIVPNSTVHKCFREQIGLEVDGTATETATEAESVVTVAPETAERAERAAEAAVATESVTSSDSEMETFRKILQQILGKPQLDAEEVKRIARDVIEGMVMPERTIIVRDSTRREIDGVVHCQMEDVLKAIAAGLNVQLVGAPGVGKTHMCGQAADALGREFYAMGFHAQSTASELRGFMSAAGDFVWTVVYDWATNPEGGVLLTDELDRSHPGIQAALNSVLSNRFITFPNRETVKLTKQHVIIAATNTFGDGPTWEFPAAQKFSAEFKDRFITITIEIDEKVETAAAMAEGAPTDVTQRALSYVRKVRRNVQKQAVEGVVITPRASQQLPALLAQEVDWDKAVAWVLRKGMDDDTWAKVA